MRAFLAVLPLLASFVSQVSAQRKCGNVHVPGALAEEAKYFQRVDDRQRKDGRVWAAAANRTLVVDTYFHIIASDKTEKNGWLPDDKVKKQFDALNRDFKSTGVSFKLKETTRTVNKEWATFSVDNDTKDTEFKMKKALRKGNYAALNVYYRPLGDGLLGICVFPDDVADKSRDFYLDGCQVLHSTVPGGSTKNYNEGKTATHEIGHWFGLFHTFQDGCDGGDLVSDTPAQKTPTDGCPKVEPDTCKGTKYPGKDPIHNFMDYSYDPCMNQFTAGQSKRLFDFWDRYRAKTKTRMLMY